MTRFGLLTVSLIICSLNQTAGEVYYITTNLTDLCTIQPCLTLSQFATNTSHYLHSNTTLIFLPGIHYLSKDNLTLSNTDNFVMKSELLHSRAQIKCASHSHFCFSQTQCIYITNLELIGCGGNQAKYVKNFVMKYTKFKGEENSGTALELIKTTAQIVNSIFASNTKGSQYQNCKTFVDTDGGRSYVDVYIGGAIIVNESIVHISQSMFEDNRAVLGGAIFTENGCEIYISKTIFVNNYARKSGGVLTSSSRLGDLCGDYNSIGSITIKISESKFYANRADNDGGVLSSSDIDFITIEESEFYNNSARSGGVLLSNKTFVPDDPFTVTMILEASEFHNNSAAAWGGVILTTSNTIRIGGSNFTKNRSPGGAVIYAKDGSIIRYLNHVLFDSNSANNSYGVVHLSNSEFGGHETGSVTFSNNIGSLVALNSNITLIGNAMFVNNLPSKTASGDFQEGGAITLLQSNIRFDGVCTLKFNHAENGGAIQATESKLYVNGNVTIAHNTATGNGGGIYLSNCEFNCQQGRSFVLFNNTAAHMGGGIHAISSSIKVSSSGIFCIQNNPESFSCDGEKLIKGNSAEMGGGLSLEANTKLYILRYQSHACQLSQICKIVLHVSIFLISISSCMNFYKLCIFWQHRLVL